MNEMDFETYVSAIAKRMDYPPTPDIAGSLGPRLRPAPRPRIVPRPFGSAQGKRLAWSLTLVLVLCSSLILIPPARAALIEFIQIGIVRIFKPEAAPVTVTPAPTAQPLLPFLNRILGETSLENAAARVNFPVRVPAYPSGLGRPDHVFVQEANGEMVILVWLDPQDPSKVRMSLHIIPAGSWAIDKAAPAIVQETEVGGLPAAWTVGPYPLWLTNGEVEFTRLVDGHVLIWADGGLTYRLETGLPLEEALKVAESLQPIP
ncbi:MAG: hypothetical protein AB1846_14980 [Chloroflexota bacterium]